MLGRPPVQEVDRLQVRVLLVPSKKGAPHAKVGHGGGHTWDEGLEEEVGFRADAVGGLEEQVAGSPIHPYNPKP